MRAVTRSYLPHVLRLQRFGRRIITRRRCPITLEPTKWPSFSTGYHTYNAAAFISFVLKTGDTRDPITRKELTEEQHQLLCRMAAGPCRIPAPLLARLCDLTGLENFRMRNSSEASLTCLMFDDAMELFSEALSVCRDHFVPVSTRLLQLSVVNFPRIRSQYGTIVRRDPDTRGALDVNFATLLRCCGALQPIMHTVLHQFTVDLKRMGPSALEYVSKHENSGNENPQPRTFTEIFMV